jgi:hypothetical protein
MFWLAFLIAGVGVLLFGPLVSVAQNDTMTTKLHIQTRSGLSSVDGEEDLY